MGIIDVEKGDDGGSKGGITINGEVTAIGIDSVLLVVQDVVVVVVVVVGGQDVVHG